MVREKELLWATDTGRKTTTEKKSEKDKFSNSSGATVKGSMNTANRNANSLPRKSFPPTEFHPPKWMCPRSTIRERAVQTVSTDSRPERGLAPAQQPNKPGQRAECKFFRISIPLHPSPHLQDGSNACLLPSEVSNETSDDMVHQGHEQRKVDPKPQILPPWRNQCLPDTLKNELCTSLFPLVGQEGEEWLISTTIRLWCVGKAHALLSALLSSLFMTHAKYLLHECPFKWSENCQLLIQSTVNIWPVDTL